MNYRIILFTIIIFILGINANATIPLDLQVYRDGESVGTYGSRNFDLIITFESPVQPNDVEVNILVDGLVGTLNPDRCEDNACFLENIFVSFAGEFEISVKHQTNIKYFIINIDTGKPAIEGLRIFQKSGNWMISANIFDPLSDGSDIPGSGIQRIDIIKNGVVDTTTISPTPNYVFEKQSPFEVSGDTITFQLRAYDKAGNVATANFNKQIDDSPPNILNVNDDNSVFYTDAQGRLVVSVLVEEDDRIDIDNSYVTIGSKKEKFESCANRGSDYYCIARITIPLSYVETSKNIIVLIRDRFGNEASSQVNGNIQVDSSRPELLRLWSEARSYDEPARPFLSQKEFFAEFDNAPSGMDPQSVVARILNPYTLEITANKCIMTSGLSRCYFTIPDISQGSVTARIVRGKDNSGNSMVESAMERLFHIDVNSHSITVGIGPSHTSLSEESLVTLPTGSSVHIRVIAAVDTGSMMNSIIIRKYSVSTNELLLEEAHDTSGCTRTTNNNFFCDIPPIAITEDARFDIIVYDGSVSNTIISRVVRTGDSLLGTNNWRITSQKTIPSFYFSGVPSQFVLNIDLSAGGSYYETTIGQAKVSGCTASSGNLQNMMAFSQKSSIRITGSLTTPETQSGKVTIDCNVEIYSLRDRYISSDAEAISVKFNLTGYSTGIDPNNPGSRASSNSNFEFLSSPTSLNIMSNAEKLVEVGETLCNAYTLFTLVSTNLDFISAGTSAGTGISIVEPVAKAVDEANTKIEVNAEKVCSYVTCKTPGAEKVLDIYNKFESPIVDKISDWGILSLQHSQNRDVQDSFVQSVLSRCVPGIIKNVRKIQQVECGYAVCLLDSETNNVPAAMCDYAKSTAQCEFIGSELFVLVPYGTIVKDFTVNLNSILTRPITIAGGFVIDHITKQNPSLRGAIKIVKYVEVLAPMFDIDISTTPSPPTVDYCSILENRRGD